jgi:hypothetical protein
VTIPGFRKALKEEDRFAIAGTIAEHLKLRSGRLDQNDEPASRYGSDQKHCAPFWFGKLPIED